MSTPRSNERLRAHYEVERELADRVRHATREERKKLYPKLYDELFERIPDHPRLTHQDTEKDIRNAVSRRLSLLDGFLSADTAFVEIAPGDCRLAVAVCESVKTVIAADISAQAKNMPKPPDNFTFIQYDGYELPIDDDSADVVFSYQFLEHLHPDDVDLHMSTVHRILKTGGVYVFDTPHRYSGPHDVSRHFDTVATGFHLKEWTYHEMAALLRRHGFSDLAPYRRGKPRWSAVARWMTVWSERLLGTLPFALRRRIAMRFYQSVAMVARK